MSDTKDVILIIVMRYLCYASNECFAHLLAQALKCQGQEVELCNIISKEDAEAQLAHYIGKKYRAVIDFNSTLPRAKVGDSYYPDCIDAPFFDYIVDHPLYHHPILSLPLKNLHVICIDKTHQAYIQQYYSHIKSTLFLPLSGSRALTQLPFSAKQKVLFFSGTYYPPHKFKEAILAKESTVAKQMLAMADCLIAHFHDNTCITPEDAFINILPSFSPLTFPNKLNQFYYADIYARSIIREEIVTKFAHSGLPLMVCGNEWNLSPIASLSNVSLHSGVDYRQCLEMIASSQALLNILPGFTEGSHDRIYNAMANTTLLFTDTNQYLSEELISGTNCLLYSYKNTAEQAEKLRELLCHEKQIEQIAFAGKELYQARHTWESCATALLEHLNILTIES